LKSITSWVTISQELIEYSFFKNHHLSQQSVFINTACIEESQYQGRSQAWAWGGGVKPLNKNIAPKRNEAHWRFWAWTFFLFQYYI